jgi:predicted small secreted protein
VNASAGLSGFENYFCLNSRRYICVSTGLKDLRIMKTKHFKIISVCSLVALTLSSCDTPRGAGAGYGAAAGAIIGGAATGRAQGALIGAAAGALTGTLVGSAIQEDQARGYGPVPEGGYPFARRTGNPGFVRSPYRPHNMVDVRGIPPGELVRDPSSGGIFRNP